ncbi:MAG: TRAP transporter large permease subunit [Chloroflexi bacterium]|nr:TRAP transporter large permease subunit [Chloroflexota bacterium]
MGIAAIIILASIYTGMITPSEAGALGTMVVLLWNFIARVPARKIANAFLDASMTTGKILICIIGGILFGRAVAFSGITKAIIDGIASADLSIAVIWAVMTVVWLLGGMVLEAVALLILTMPFAFPVMTGMGVDPVVLGIVTIIMIEMAVITPPVGFNCYVVASIAGVDPIKAFKGIAPFCAVLILSAVIIILFPELATWLPDRAFGASIR